MKEVLCPYCCKRFKPTQVDFRLERPVDEERTEKEEAEKALPDKESSRRGASRRATNRPGYVRDEKLYLSNVEKLLNRKETLSATQRIKNPPMPFLYTYRTADSQEKKYKIIIFCDISGEDCRNVSDLKDKGYHLTASDGFLFLLDVTRFPSVVHTVENGSSISNLMQGEVFSEINRYMLADSYEDTIAIPSAMVLTKCDMLREVGKVYGVQKYREILEDTRRVHTGFLDLEEINHLNHVIPELMADLGESRIPRRVEDNFATYSYFVTSALGKAASKITEVTEGEKERKIQGQIEPYRVEEPFYWLLAKKNCIPYRYWEIQEHDKGKQVNITLNFYEEEKQFLNGRIEEKRREKGVKNSLFSGKWTRKQGTQL